MSAPYVNIELDEKRKLQFRHNDMADIEQLTGKGLGELLQSTQFHGIRVVLAHGLRFMDPKMNATKAGDLIQDHWIAKGKTLDQLADVIESALVAGGIMPAKAKDKTDLEPSADLQKVDEGHEQPEAPIALARGRSRSR